MNIPEAPFDEGRIAADAAASALYENIRDATRSGDVLVLLSGGSVVPIAITALNLLSREGKSKISIGQVDERYGAVGHAHSNWLALQRAGLVENDFAHVLPILTEGLSRQETADVYAEKLTDAISKATTVLGLLGIGADGHTAGMLPHPYFHDEFLDPETLVFGYEGPDFERITVTERMLSLMNAVVVFAAGQQKVAAIKKLSEDSSVKEMPARILLDMSHVDMFIGKEA